METVKALVDRFMRLAGFKTRREVARALGLKESDLSERIRHNLRVNLTYRLVRYGLAKGIPLDLIFKAKTLELQVRKDLVVARLAAVRARLPSHEFEQIFRLTGMLWEILVTGSPSERHKYFRLSKAIIDSLYREKTLIGVRKGGEREHE